MLNVSNAFNEAFKSSTRQVLVRVTMKDVVYTNNDVFDVEYVGGSITGETFNIGSVFSNSIKITFTKVIEAVKQLDKIKLEFGIVLADGSKEFVSMGYFFVDKYNPDRNSNRTIIESLDQMTQLERVYKSELTYPARIKDVALEIANLSGSFVDQASFERLSTSAINKIEGKTYRQAIGLIAQFAGGFAIFDRDGKLSIRTLSDPNFSISTAEYFSRGLVKNETMYTLGGISCKVTTKNGDTSTDFMLQSGSPLGNQIVLENSSMTQILLDGIYQQLKNTNYYPYTLSWRGNPALEAGDWISMSDTKANSFKMPNLTYKLSFSGGLKATSSADTSSVSQATASYRGPLKQQVLELQGWKSAAGGWTYTGTTEPSTPKEGDVWFKPNGPDTETLIYEGGKWVFQTSTAGIRQVTEEMNQAQKDIVEAKKAADDAVDKANQNIKEIGELDIKLIDTKTLTDKALADVNKIAAENKVLVDKAQVDATKAITDAKTAYDKAVENSGKIVTVNQNVDKIKGEITTKVEKTDFDKSLGRITQAESSITQNANAITQKVSSTDVENILTGKAYVTKSELTQTSNSLTSTISGVQSNVDALGTNTAYAYSADGTDGFTTVYPNLNLLSLSSVKIGQYLNWSNGLDLFGNAKRAVFDYIQVVPNQTYTLSSSWNGWYISVFGYSDKTSSAKHILTSGKMQPITGSGFSESKNVTFAVPSDCNYLRVHIGNDSINTSASVVKTVKAKIEQGSTATPYTPSSSEVTTADYPKYRGLSLKYSTNPSDYKWEIDSGYTDAKTVVQQTQISQMSQDLNGFKTTVSSTYLTTANASNTYPTKDAVSGTYLNKGDASNTYPTKTTVTSQINQSATDITNSVQSWTNGKLNGYSTIQQTNDSITSTIAGVQVEIDKKANQSQVTQLSQDLSGFKTTVSSTYLNKTDASNTYPTKDAVANTYPTKTTVATQISQSATDITSSVQSWTNGKLTGYSTTQQTNNSITSAVSGVNAKLRENLISNSDFRNDGNGWVITSNSNPAYNIITKNFTWYSQLPKNKPTKYIRFEYANLDADKWIVSTISNPGDYVGTQLRFSTYYYGDNTPENGFEFYSRVTYDGKMTYFNTGTSNAYGKLGGWNRIDFLADLSKFTNPSLLTEINLSFKVKGATNSSGNVSFTGFMVTEDGNLYDWSYDYSANPSYSQIVQLSDQIVSAVKDKADKSQVTQLSDQITSAVTQMNSENMNFVLDGSFQTGDNWSTTSTTSTTYTLNNSKGIPISAGSYLRMLDTKDEYFVTQSASTQVINSLKNSTVTFSMYVKCASGSSDTFRIYIRTKAADGTLTYLGRTNQTVTTSWKRLSITVEIPADVTELVFTANVRGLPNVYCYFTGAQATVGNVLLPYAESTLNLASKSQITQLSDMINLRVLKGDVASQINIEAGRTLIDTKQLLLNANTVKFSGSAFIPDAMIQNLTASKINVGTLNGANVNIINLNASNITGGTLNAIDIKGSNITSVGENYTLNQKNGSITWNRNSDGKKVFGIETQVEPSNEGNTVFEVSKKGSLSIFSKTEDVNIYKNLLTFYNNADNGITASSSVDKIFVQGTDNSASRNQTYSLTISESGISYTSSKSTRPTFNFSNFNSAISFLVGDDISSISLIGGVARVKSKYTTISGDFTVTGSKNAIHATRDGVRATPAYETAESYLGDIGSNYTRENCEVWIEIERLFSDTVNTDIAYQVFLQAYDDAKFWVADFKSDKFLIKSDKPLSRFAWEIKAKRRGYENDRLVLQEDFDNKKIEESWGEK